MNSPQPGNFEIERLGILFAFSPPAYQEFPEFGLHLQENELWNRPILLTHHHSLFTTHYPLKSVRSAFFLAGFDGNIV
jgi:hypothetical protein